MTPAGVGRDLDDGRGRMGGIVGEWNEWLYL